MIYGGSYGRTTYGGKIGGLKKRIINSLKGAKKAILLSLNRRSILTNKDKKAITLL